MDKNSTTALLPESVLYMNLGIVFKLAHRFSLRLHLSEFAREDLLQEGTLGLMRAWRTWDAERGIKFITYAFPWVKVYMLDWLYENLSIVRGSRAHRERKKGVLENLMTRDGEMEEALDVIELKRVWEAGGNVPVDVLLEGLELRAKVWETVERMMERGELKDWEVELVEQRVLSELPRPRRELAEVMGVSAEMVRVREGKVREKLMKELRKVLKGSVM